MTAGDPLAEAQREAEQGLVYDFAEAARFAWVFTVIDIMCLRNSDRSGRRHAWSDPDIPGLFDR